MQLRESNIDQLFRIQGPVVVSVQWRNSSVRRQRPKCKHENSGVTYCELPVWVERHRQCKQLARPLTADTLLRSARYIAGRPHTLMAGSDAPVRFVLRVISLISTGANRLDRNFLCTHRKLISTIGTVLQNNISLRNPAIKGHSNVQRSYVWYTFM